MKPVQNNQNTQLESWVTNFVLFILVAASFVWSKTAFSTYTPHLITLLVIFYLILHFKLRGQMQAHNIDPDIYIALVIVFLLIFTTGGLSSPTFFLIYFLLFGSALLISTSSAFVIAAVSAVLFLTSLHGEPIRELLQIFSLFLIAPIAKLFGTQYLQLEQNKQKMELLKANADMVREELKENKIIQENKSKMVSGYNSVLIKKPLTDVWQQIDEISSIKSLPKEVYVKLEKAGTSLQKILKGADKISEETKEE